MLIFANLKPALSSGQSHRYYGGNEKNDCLPLGEEMMLKTVGEGLESPPLVVFICRQFNIADIYEKWLDKKPNFYVVTEYSNPMDTFFTMPYIEPHHFNNNMRNRNVETLRTNLELAENTIIVAMIDNNGILKYINTNASKELSKSLTDINVLIRKQ